jgi:hypothetical protein
MPMPHGAVKKRKIGGAKKIPSSPWLINGGDEGTWFFGGSALSGSFL